MALPLQPPLLYWPSCETGFWSHLLNFDQFLPGLLGILPRPAVQPLQILDVGPETPLGIVRLRSVLFPPYVLTWSSVAYVNHLEPQKMPGRLQSTPRPPAHRAASLVQGDTVKRVSTRVPVGVCYRQTVGEIQALAGELLIKGPMHRKKKKRRGSINKLEGEKKGRKRGGREETYFTS